jgi:hypothetical protein
MKLSIPFFFSLKTNLDACRYSLLDSIIFLYVLGEDT